MDAAWALTYGLLLSLSLLTSFSSPDVPELAKRSWTSIFAVEVYGLSNGDFKNNRGRKDDRLVYRGEWWERVYPRIARRRSGVAVVGRRGINWTGALLRLTGSAGEEAG